MQNPLMRAIERRRPGRKTTSKRRASRVVAVALAAAVATIALATVGCGTTKYHQVIKTNETCSSCHSDGRTPTDDALEGATSVSTNLTVKTDSDTIYVCTPLNTGKKSITFVPRLYDSFLVEDGSVELTLSEGTWAIAVTDGSTTTNAVLVEASPDGTTTEITL
jgi:hypothetical protein